MCKTKTFTKDIQKVIEILGLFSRIRKLCFINLILSCLFDSILPFIPMILSAKIIDELLGNKDEKLTIIYLIMLIGLTLIAITFKSYFSEKHNNDKNYIYYSLYKKLAQKSMTMDYQYVESKIANNILDKVRLCEYNKANVYGILDFCKFGINSLMTFIYATIIVSRLFINGNNNLDSYKIINSSYMGIIFVVLIIVAMLINAKVNRRIFLLYLKFNKKWKPSERGRNYLFNKLLLNDENGKDIRLYDAKKMLIWRNQKNVNDVFKNGLNTFYKNVLKNFSSTQIANNVILAFVYIFVLTKAYIGAISIGSILIHVGAVTRFYNSIDMFFRSLMFVRTHCNTMSCYLDYLELPDEKCSGTKLITIDKKKEYKIEFCNVSFKYPNTENYVLKNINIKINSGRRIAIVGMNGAGKTTMIKLLCRLYDPTEGVVKLNGIDIKKYVYEQYLELFSVVFQDFKLFSFTIEENISGKHKTEKERIIKALHDSGIYEKVQNLRDKEKTSINNNYDERGVGLSGGEQQKIAIARALYKDAPIVILDEPTAALDPISEHEIYTKFDILIEDKTAIYISHRLSSCRFCHSVFVIHEGEIVQQGNHDVIVKQKKGKYYELWNAQAQHYK